MWPGRPGIWHSYPAFPYSTIDNVDDAGLADCNSLQIKAEIKSTRYGIYALAGYTYSRAYDTVH
jgi:hypothetical protein